MHQRKGRENVATLSTSTSGDRDICLKRYGRLLPMSLRFWEPIASSRNVKQRTLPPLGSCRKAAWNMKGRFMMPTLRGIGHNVIATESPLRRLKRSDLSSRPTYPVRLNASPQSLDVSHEPAFLALFISLRNPWDLSRRELRFQEWDTLKVFLVARKKDEVIIET